MSVGVPSPPGRGTGRGDVFDGLEDDLEHLLCVEQDLIVPETQDAQVKLFELQRPAIVVVLLSWIVVASTVELDDKASVIAKEIDPAERGLLLKALSKPL